MTQFISYAQNFEDIMLWRALKDVKNGFYIDVGANDPNVDSVTKAFYLRGWRGINIEPMSSCYAKLCVERAEDINLQLLVSSTEGKADFYEIEGTGLSTTDSSLAQEHENQDFKAQKTEREVKSLDSICQERVHGEIHFLKVDVEGAEEAVLRSASLERFRPWIIVVEATKPNSSIRSDDGVRDYLLARRYREVYFDGLNSYFIAEEHGELEGAFDCPPNVFDNFVRPHCNVDQLEKDLNFAKMNVNNMAIQRNELMSKISILEQKVESMQNSISWKLTSPVRFIDNIKRKFIKK